MLGLLVAVELFLDKDHARERREYDKRAETIRAAAAAVPGVKAEVFVPQIANNVPHIRVSWEGATEATASAVVKAMRDGEPSIGIRSESKALVLGVWMLKPGEDKVVARRLAPDAGRFRSQAGVTRRIARLLPLVGLVLIAGPGSSADDARARVRFPADVPPRNDIRVDNLVPVRMRDGVTLYADVYRPLGEGRYPVIVSRTPYSTERFPSAFEAARLLRAARLRLRVPGHPRAPRVRGTLGALLRRREGRLRHGRVGREAAVVERQGRHAGRLLPGAEPVAGRAGRAAQPGHDLPDGVLDQPLSRLDHAQRRLAALLQLRLGTGAPGVADHAEPRPPHARGGSRDPLRPGAAPPSVEDDAAARGAPRALLRRLARPPRLRRLLEAAQRGGAVRQDNDSGAHPRWLVRHLQPGHSARLRGHEPQGRLGCRRAA